MKPGEHKTVQARILTYVEEIGWAFVPREEVERRRGFDPDATSKDRAKAGIKQTPPLMSLWIYCLRFSSILRMPS